MKKTFLILLAVAVSVMAAVVVLTPKSDAESLLDANVKALAESVGAEVGISSGRTQCFNEYKLCQPTDKERYECLRCGSCDYIGAKGTNVGGWCRNSKIKGTIGSDDPHARP